LTPSLLKIENFKVFYDYLLIKTRILVNAQKTPKYKQMMMLMKRSKEVLGNI